jgi:hypothetical protein
MGNKKEKETKKKNITPMCVLIHFLFHYILNELKQIYHGES